MEYDAWLDDDVNIVDLVTDDGTPRTGLDIYLIIMRVSDGLFYDFDDGTFKDSPTTEYDSMTESEDLDGIYTYTFNTSVLNDPDELVFYVYYDGAPDYRSIHRVRLLRRRDREVIASIAMDYDSEILSIGACLLEHEGIIEDVDRCTFEILDDEGSEVMAEEQVDESTAGFFSFETSTISLEDHSTYYLRTVIEYDDRSYSNIKVFNTL